MQTGIKSGFYDVFRHPIQSLLRPENRAVTLVYGSTYIAKNSTENISIYNLWDTAVS